MPILCDGGNARADLLRALRCGQQCEERPRGIHGLDQEEQGGFLGRSNGEFCFIWPWMSGFGV